MKKQWMWCSFVLLFGLAACGFLQKPEEEESSSEALPFPNASSSFTRAEVEILPTDVAAEVISGWGEAKYLHLQIKNLHESKILQDLYFEYTDLDRPLAGPIYFGTDMIACWPGETKEILLSYQVGIGLHGTIRLIEAGFAPLDSVLPENEVESRND